MFRTSVLNRNVGEAARAMDDQDNNLVCHLARQIKNTTGSTVVKPSAIQEYRLSLMQRLSEENFKGNMIASKELADQLQRLDQNEKFLLSMY